VIVDNFQFALGNGIIGRSALTAGIQFAAGYPGTPSTEILPAIIKEAKRLGIHAEWSANEKTATEAAAAAALAGLRAVSAMKNAGLNVALDFLAHLALSGLGTAGGALVIISCDDPEGHSSGDETDARWLARFAGAPLLEAESLQEVEKVMKYAFDLSEKYALPVIFRGYTRLCHASSAVPLRALDKPSRKAKGRVGMKLSPYLARVKHAELLQKLDCIQEEFDASALNGYSGSEHPELLIVSSGSGSACAQEAVEILGLSEKVGILNLATIWPFPKRLVKSFAAKISRILVAEEVDPFIELEIKQILLDAGIGGVVFGKESGHIPRGGEISPDKVGVALAKIFGIDWPSRTESYKNALNEAKQVLISRGLTWCPGCPHRASFHILEKAVKSDGRDFHVAGDIGCYCLDVFPEGKHQIGVLHCMGSSTGLGSGFGQLAQFGLNEPAISLCGDGTFFHAGLPGLINAIYNRANLVHIILDNSATAMTGFQSHPGSGANALGDVAPKLDIEKLCQALGCHVVVSDPFDVRGSIKKLKGLLKENNGVRVLILRRPCEILRFRQEKSSPFKVRVDSEECHGLTCEVCTTQFRCPALVRNAVTDKAEVRLDVCSGCGACVEICPFKVIVKEEARS
jgi:indolepyruvate ferredoxin oxidoreductase alpha subunit